MTEFTKAMSSTTALMTNLLLCVALISLVVGGVGIMNIMLVSVTERTREIGLRMAVGARGTRHPAAVHCGGRGPVPAGRGAGILVGRGTSLMVRTFKRWPTELSVGAICAAVLVSVSVGVIFGYYPAGRHRASTPSRPCATSDRGGAAD